MTLTLDTLRNAQEMLNKKVDPQPLLVLLHPDTDPKFVDAVRKSGIDVFTDKYLPAYPLPLRTIHEALQ